MLMCFMPQMDAFTLGGAVVILRYCKQTILIQSTMEVELTTLDIVTTKANWSHDLFTGLRCFKTHYVLFLSTISIKL